MSPLRQKPSRVFFGWWIVAASFFISLYVSGSITYGFTAIFEPIADEFGWSYAQVSLAASIRGLEMSLFAPLIGVLVDRLGPRRLIFSGAVIAAAGLILLSFTRSLGMFYGAFVLIAMGVGCCTVTVLMTTIANWFRRKVGIASGIAISGTGFGGLLIPLIVRLTDLYDWRMTMTTLAIGMVVTFLPLSLLFRHRPEQYGYLPDGQAEAPVPLDNSTRLSPAVEVEIKAKHALRSSIFWRIVPALMLLIMINNAITTHIMPYLSSVSIVRATSSLVVTAIPLTSIIGRLGLGWLGDKLDRRRMLAVGSAMMGLGVLCLAYVSSTSTSLLVPFIILFTIGLGSMPVLTAPLLRGYFGLTNFGTIFGLQIGISMLVGMLGPILAGWTYDNWSSYQSIWLIFAGLSVVSVVLFLTLPPVRLATELADNPGA